jgi:hypothetical protein
MSIVYRREIPRIITFLVGIVLVAAYFVDLPLINSLKEILTTTGSKIIPFTFILGTLALAIHSLREIFQKRKDIYLNAAILVSMSLMVFFGIMFGGQSTGYQWMVDWIITPVETIMGALVIFWIAQSAFRIFRIQSLEAALIATTCFLTILGNIPTVAYISPELASLGAWLKIEINQSVARGLWMGVGIGAIILGVRILLGLERGYLGE